MGRAETYFESARLDHALRFLKHPSIIDPTKLSSTKPAYPPAIGVAKAILSNQGINIRSQGKDIVLPCVLINMENIFEAYLRAILDRHLRDRGFTVLDGNLGEPHGAARDLFAHAHEAAKGIPAKPDVVINRGSPLATTELVIDAKYKPPSSQPDREDLNQILVYSMVYKCKKVALA